MAEGLRCKWHVAQNVLGRKTYGYDLLMRSVVRAQDSIFAIYNSGYGDALPLAAPKTA